MAKGRNGSIPEEAQEEEKEKERVRDDNLSKSDRHRKSKRRKEESSSEESSTDAEDNRPHRSKKRKRRRRSSRRSSDSSTGSDSGSDSELEESVEESDSVASGSEEGSEDEVRKKKRKEKKRRRREREKEEERERRRRKEKRRRREKEERRRKKDKEKKKKKKKEKDGGKKGAVTNSWGKYGIIRETDMWNKRPEFTAWLSEVKQVNLETLPNWEEKQMFKQFMEDHNTATFPSKKYYNLDAYHHHKLEKEMKKGLKKASNTERTIFNDEEQRRLELMRDRERQKEEQVEALKRSMQGGMAQAMKDQARLKEEMAYQYKLGNFEAAAAIQRRLDPDVAM